MMTQLIGSAFTHKRTPLFVAFRLTNPTILKTFFATSVCAACAVMPSAFAQTSPTAPVQRTDDKIEEMTVVGSRIRQTDLKTISPTTHINWEDTAAAGLSSAAELLQSTAVTTGASQINNAYGGYVTKGGPGANTISLRGLGESRTLVLINGRRVSPSGSQGAIGTADLNVLPSAMIERVEILRDGASSIYGSDAVSGVINVITREDVNGLTLQGTVNYPTEGDGEQARLALSGGFNEEKFSLSGSFDYYERKELRLADRDWTRCNRYQLRDPQTGESLDFIDPKTGSAKCYPTSLAGANGTTINTIGTQTINATNWQTLGLSGRVVGAPGSSGASFNRFRPNANVQTGIIGYEGVGGGANSINVRDTFEPRMLNEDLISPSKIYTGFLQGKYQLDALGNTEIYGELLTSRRESEQTGYRQLTMDYRRGTPVIPQELEFANFGPAQETSGNDRIGVRAFIGFGNDHSEQTVNYYKPTLGIRGDFNLLPDWRYDLYASFAKNDAEYVRQSFLIDKLTYASDVTDEISGVDSTLIRNGVTCEINRTNPAEQCVPFPLLTANVVNGNLPSDFRNYIFRNTVGTTDYNEAIYAGFIDGPLFDLPAGKVQTVFGLEHRQMEIHDQPDENSINGNLYNLSGAAPTIGDDYVTEAYSEIQIPILSDMAFAKDLKINGSLRYTDYDSYGADDTYKIGLIYSPLEWVSLRASRGTSYRAPALFEQFQGATSGFRPASLDPCNNYGDSDVNPNRARNCAAELPGQPAFESNQSVQVVTLGGAETGLFAETSDNITYGLVLDPSFGDSTDVRLAIDYFDIEVTNGVQQAGETEILQRCYDSNDFATDSGLCRLVSRNPVDAQLIVNDAYTNLATEKVRGLDINVNVDQQVGPGTFSTTLNLTRYYEQAEKIFVADDLVDYNGSLEKPEFGGAATLAYTIDAWRVLYGIDWLSSMDGYEEADEDPAESESDYTVPSYLTHRISVRYQADTWKATLGVRNLTNQTPHEISAGYFNRVGNSPLYSGYDYVGREVFLNFQVSY